MTNPDSFGYWSSYLCIGASHSIWFIAEFVQFKYEVYPLAGPPTFISFFFHWNATMNHMKPFQCLLAFVQELIHELKTWSFLEIFQIEIMVLESCDMNFCEYHQYCHACASRLNISNNVLIDYDELISM